MQSFHDFDLCNSLQSVNLGPHELFFYLEDWGVLIIYQNMLINFDLQKKNALI